MASKKQSRKNLVEKVIQDHLHKMKVDDCLFHPEIPEVISNPSFLVVPKLGSLLAVYIYELPEPSKFWMFALEVIEDLFEVKTAAGENTTVALILLESDPINQGLYNFRLFERLFDKTIRLNSSDNKLDRSIRQFVDDLLSNPRPKQEYIHLWESEIRARTVNYENISQNDYVLRMITELNEGTPELLANGLTRDQLREKTASLQGGSNNYTLFREPKVNNIKELILSSATSFYFTFDFGLDSNKNRFSVGHYISSSELDDWFASGSAFINVMRGSNKSYPHLNFLRRMATYSRFISYQVDGPTGDLELRDFLPKLYMVLEGSIIGPDYDPTRYLRMITSAGWTPIRFNTFSMKFIEGGL